MSKLTESQKRAQRKWEEGNKEKRAVIRDRSAAKRFILKMAEEEDLKTLEELLNNRKKDLT